MTTTAVASDRKTAEDDISDVTRPATLAEAEALAERLNHEMRVVIPLRTTALNAGRQRASDSRSPAYDPAKAEALRAEVFQLAERSNTLLKRLVPAANQWLGELRKEQREATERDQLAQLVNGRDLPDALVDAQSTVQRLEDEGDNLGTLLTAAVAAADYGRIGELRHRREVLPDELLAARISLARVEMAQLLARADELRAAQGKARAEVDKAEASLKIAQDKATAARHSYDCLLADEREASQTAQARRRWIQDQMSNFQSGR